MILIAPSAFDGAFYKKDMVIGALRLRSASTGLGALSTNVFFKKGTVIVPGKELP